MSNLGSVIFYYSFFLMTRLDQNKVWNFVNECEVSLNLG